MKANLPGSKISIKEACRKEVDAYFDRKSLDFDAAILFVLNREFGFGKDRLKRFYFSYATDIRKMIKDYDELAFEKVRDQLKRIGVDVAEWDRQVNE